MKIGITGHQKLENPKNWNWVKLEFNKIIGQSSKPFTGVTSLAIGADQLFAEAVLKHGGSLTVIILLIDMNSSFQKEMIVRDIITYLIKLRQSIFFREWLQMRSHILKLERQL